MNPLQEYERQLILAKHQSFFGSFAQQNPAAFLSFNRLLNAKNFDTIIELGTHDAGLSTLFALYAFQSKYAAQSDDPNEPVLYKNRTHHRRPKQFFTFDKVVRDKTAIKILKHLGANFILADTLGDQLIIDQIRAMIGGPTSGTVLLLCDGGNKKRELDLYGGSLKSGDFVMLHDWARDESAYQSNVRNGVWTGWESRWEDGVGEDQQFGIRTICERHGVEPIYPEEFDGVAWFCGFKN